MVSAGALIVFDDFSEQSVAFPIRAHLARLPVDCLAQAGSSVAQPSNVWPKPHPTCARRKLCRECCQGFRHSCSSRGFIA